MRPSTLVSLLRDRGRTHAGRPLYTFLQDGERESETWTCGQMDAAAARIAVSLQQRGLTGQRIVLLGRSSGHYLAAFFGCLYAGAVAVPWRAGFTARDIEPFAAVVEDADAAAVMVSGRDAARLQARYEREARRRMQWLDAAQCDVPAAGEWEELHPHADDLAYLQYTSGSTSTPKGVEIRHRNVLANEEMIQQAFDQDERSIVVGWLPLYHDMGLIGTALQPLYAGGRAVLFSPAAFLQRPVRWLNAITRYRATTSGAPNFAYELCARAVSAEDRATLNLESWRVAFNGAEPVRSETMEAFTTVFGPCGFSPDAFVPCYGLAEATLLVSAGRASPTGPLRVAYDGAADTAPPVVSCGAIAQGQTVVIVDPATGEAVPTKTVGEICVAGPSVSAGYWNRPEETAAAFRHVSGNTSNLLRTGDLGFLHDGQLFVSGRAKEVIIVRGVNYYPEDIEFTVGRCHPRLMTGSVAVFTVADEGRERLVIAAEASTDDPAGFADIWQAIRRAVWEHHELSADQLCLVRPGRLPKTSTGKVRRGACRSALISGALATIASDSLALAATPGAGATEWDAVIHADELTRPQLVAAYVRARVARVLGVAVADVGDVTLAELGLDSMKAMELQACFSRDAGAAYAEWLGAATIADLCARILAEWDSVPLEPRARPAEAAVEGECPLPANQHALWYVDRIANTPGLFNIASAARVSGVLEPDDLRAAFDTMAARHAALRTGIIERSGRPVGVVHAARRPQFEDHAAADWSPAQIDEFLRAHASLDFDLEGDSLCRVYLLRRGPTESIVLLVMHHQTVDLWSFAIILRELAQLLNPQGRLDPAPRLDWRDRARDESHPDADAEVDRLAGYWRSVLTPLPLPLDLPFDRPRPAVQTYRGASEPLEISGATTAALLRIGREHRATLHMVLVAAFEALIYRYTKRTDFLIGTPTSGRTDDASRDVVGYFVNPVVLRARVDSTMRFSDLLDQVRETSAGAWAHQQLPFSIMAERVGYVRDRRHPPLFQLMLTLQTPPPGAEAGLAAFASGAPGARMTVGGLAWESMHLPRETSEVDLGVVFGLTPDGLRGTLVYNVDLFDAATARRFAGRLQSFLSTFADHPEHSIDLPLLTPAETTQILAENRTGWPIPAEPVHRAFERVAAATPDARAVIFEDRELSFRDVNALANQIARRLRGSSPAASAIGLLLERCAEIPSAMLGAMKAALPYVPLDPSWPTQRLRDLLRDAGVSTVVTTGALATKLADVPVGVLCLDDCHGEDGGDLDHQVSLDDLAYVLYTSGSTGAPKAVLVTHASVANLFTAMDRVVPCAPSDVMLAVTALTFDISILELLWPLSRACEVIVTSPPQLAPRVAARHARALDYSLFYFAQDTAAGSGRDRYRLLLEGARFADAKGFTAVWTPERHFDTFGGLYPNPAITSAALAMATERVAIRAGSVVLPLHNPVRVAEDWALIDNLSDGRVGIAFASGWHADDFALAPDHYAKRKQVMSDGIETVRRLWRGEAVALTSGSGNEIAVRIYPRPVQPELPCWITAAGAEETFRLAGKMGVNVLTHLLGQSVEDLAASVKIYREARAGHGFDPSGGIVTTMVHTFVGRSGDGVKDIVREPMKRYLRGAVGLMSKFARTVGLEFDPEAMSPRDQDALLEHAFERYYHGSSLLGSVDGCRKVVDGLADAGVDEVACLIDFGIDDRMVLESLTALNEVRAPDRAVGAKPDYGCVAQAARFAPTLFQCTPSLLEVLMTDGGSRSVFGSLRALLVGGEAMPAGMVDALRQVTSARIVNMYGPTETTVWSTAHEVVDHSTPVPIGSPIANTEIYVLDDAMALVPHGVVGELYIGGAGVARGYKDRAALTAERFVPDPFAATPAARLYRTGDLVKRRSDGAIEWLGRADLQVKIRGHRIELGEIEAALLRMPEVQSAALVSAPGTTGPELVAFLVVKDSSLDEEQLRSRLGQMLPAHLLPQRFVRLGALPRTAHGKLDRRALAAMPRHDTGLPRRTIAAPQSDLEKHILATWQSALVRNDIGIDDNFFDVGGHSLLLAQVHSELQTQLHREWPLVRMLEHSTVSALARFLTELPDPSGAPAQPRSHDRRAALLRRSAVMSATRH